MSGDRLKSTEVNVVQRPGYDTMFNHRIQIHRLVGLQQRNLVEHVPAICPAESAAHTLLNTKFIHYYCWVFRRQDKQNQHQSPTDGTREGQLQAYSALHKACKRTWNPLPPELWRFHYTGSRKIQLSELTVTPEIPLLCAARLEK